MKNIGNRKRRKAAKELTQLIDNQKHNMEMQKLSRLKPIVIAVRSALRQMAQEN